MKIHPFSNQRRGPIVSGSKAHFCVRHAAFTLIELLTVIAIIGILAAIIIPTVSKVRKQALSQQCAANVRSWGQAIQLYAQNNRGKFYAWDAWSNSFTVTNVADPKGPYLEYMSVAKSNPTARFTELRHCAADLGADGNPRLINTGNLSPSYNFVNARKKSSDATGPADGMVDLNLARTPSRLLVFVESTGASGGSNNARISSAAELVSATQPLWSQPTVYRDRHGGKVYASFADGHLGQIYFTPKFSGDPNSIAMNKEEFTVLGP